MQYLISMCGFMKSKYYRTTNNKVYRCGNMAVFFFRDRNSGYNREYDICEVDNMVRYDIVENVYNDYGRLGTRTHFRQVSTKEEAITEMNDLFDRHYFGMYSKVERLSGDTPIIRIHADRGIRYTDITYMILDY